MPGRLAQGRWEISLLAWENVERLNQEHDLGAVPGSFAENLTTQGLDTCLSESKRGLGRSRNSRPKSSRRSARRTHSLPLAGSRGAPVPPASPPPAAG